MSEKTTFLTDFLRIYYKLCDIVMDQQSA